MIAFRFVIELPGTVVRWLTWFDRGSDWQRTTRCRSVRLVGEPKMEVLAAIEGRTLDAVAWMLADAFHGDPMQRWLFPFEPRRRARLARYFELDIRHRLNRQSIVHLADEAGGVAFWHPPGSWAPSSRSLLAIAPAFLSVARHHPMRAPRVLRGVIAHHPTAAHWYLSHLGVAPERQGAGVGRALVEAGLRRADADGVGAYLETTNPDNVDFYEAVGFGALGTCREEGAPDVWLLWRPPTDTPTQEESQCSQVAAAAHRATFRHAEPLR